MKTVVQRTVKGIIFCLLLALWLNLLTSVFRMKVGVELSDGYRTGGNTYDLIIAGSSVPMYGINPMELWKHDGITAYNLSSGFQSVAASYYVVKDAIERCHPKAVLLDCGRIVNEEKIESSARLHYITDQMPFADPNRMAAIRDLADEEEWTSFYFPLETYHLRWLELSKTDFQYNSRNQAAGARLIQTCKSTEYFVNHEIQTNQALAETPVKYLQKIIDLCRKTDTEIYLMVMPAVGAGAELTQEGYDLRRNGAYALEDYAQEQKIPYFNWIDQAQEFGLDCAEDTMDGEHLTILGAEKFTDKLGDYLLENGWFEDHRGDPAYKYMEKAYEEYVPYRLRQALQTTNRFQDYVDFLTEDESEDYLLLMAAGARKKKLPERPDLDAQMEKLGLTTNTSNYQGNEYIAVIDGGRVIYESAGDETDVTPYTAKIDGIEFQLGCVQQDGESHVEILIDGQDYAQSDAGLNIVVYQKSARSVIATSLLKASQKKISFKQGSGV